MDLYRHFVKSIAKITAGVMHELASGINAEAGGHPTVVHIHIYPEGTVPAGGVHADTPRPRRRWAARS
ncbi:hypothetical protein AXA44_02675 [Rhodococcus sp. SC4]|nr:hypothetical protein AXA44_02675 [Rhodococcus sp. SC4]